MAHHLYKYEAAKTPVCGEGKMNSRGGSGHCKLRARVVKVGKYGAVNVVSEAGSNNRAFNMARDNKRADMAAAIGIILGDEIFSVISVASNASICILKAVPARQRRLGTLVKSKWLRGGVLLLFSRRQSIVFHLSLGNKLSRRKGARPSRQPGIINQGTYQARRRAWYRLSRASMSVAPRRAAALLLRTSQADGMAWRRDQHHQNKLKYVSATCNCLLLFHLWQARGQAP